MGGQNGLTIQQFAEYSDRQIFYLLMIELDDDGRLITEAEQGEEQERSNIKTAGRDLPTWETMGLSQADVGWMQSLRPFADTYYLAMFAQIWQGRGKTREEILELWQAHAMSSN